jgi:hypothetical protein
MNQTHSTCDSVEPQKCGILKRTLQVMFTCGCCSLVYFLGRQHSNTRVLSELTGGLFAQMFSLFLTAETYYSIATHF